MTGEVVLDFRLVPIDPIYADDHRRLDSVGVSTIEYHLFHGIVTFRIGDVEFGLRVPIPVVEFARCMLWLARQRFSGLGNSFEFTEGEGEIFFDMVAPGVVSVRCDYHEEQAQVSALELHEASLAFARRVLDMLRSDFPDILENQEFIDWFLPLLEADRDRFH
ncbi:MAG: hypothetical protein RIE84_09285 [Parvibaculum sp.]|uniref:hypothetical protein n=1 Tax=Parvibaculum sp. TaxID=2024848 RepID=UPI0032EF032A